MTTGPLTLGATIGAQERELRNVCALFSFGSKRRGRALAHEINSAAMTVLATRYPNGTPFPFSFWGLLIKTEQ